MQTFWLNRSEDHKKTLSLCVTILLGNFKRPVEVGNPNTCAEIKLLLLLFFCYDAGSRDVCYDTAPYCVCIFQYRRMIALDVEARSSFVLPIYLK